MGTRFYSNVEYGSSSGRGNNDPDIIYYNASIVNNNIANGNANGFNGVGNYEDTQVTFNDQRQLPILQNASEYNMSVIRFDLAGATKSLPLFVPRIVPGQSDVNLTIYNVSVSLAVSEEATPDSLVFYTATYPVIWVPQYVTQDNLPQTANPQQIFSTDYYYCDNYIYWAGLVNTTVQTCIIDILAQLDAAGVPSGPVNITNSPIPNLFYNPTTKLFSWSFDARFWGGDATSGFIGGYGYKYQLALDTNLETLLTNFVVTYDDTIQPAFPLDANLNIIRIWAQQIAIDTDPTTGQAYTTPNATGHVRYIITQDYGSISGNWSPIDSIVITSSKLPIYPEIIAPAPGTFGNSDLGMSSATTGSAFQYVIADIQVGKTGADEWRQFMEYEPMAEYKILSLNKSQEPIQNIDFMLWWRNRYDNNLYPLRLYNGSAVSIKIMFRRKFL